MSWGIRAHIRNVILKASLGAGFNSTAELKKGSAALCTLETCPYPGFDEKHHHAPPTDDTTFVDKQLKMAVDRFGDEFRMKCLQPRELQYLKEKLAAPIAVQLLKDLFWWRYLTTFGVRFASPETVRGEHMATFRSVLRDMFMEIDADGSGEVDASELSAILAGLGIALPEALCADLIALVDDNGNGLLDMEEFLQMMCVEVIADCSVSQVKADAEQYRHRCCRLWWELFHPKGTKEDLQRRDAVSPIFCRVLSRAVLLCFFGCFSKRTNAELASTAFLVNLEEDLAQMFLGARRPNLPPPPPAISLRPWSARGRGPFSESRASASKLSSPTKTPRPPSAQRPASVVVTQHQPRDVETESVAESKSSTLAETQSRSDVERESASSDGVANLEHSNVTEELRALYRQWRPYLFEPIPGGSPFLIGPGGQRRSTIGAALSSAPLPPPSQKPKSDQRPATANGPTRSAITFADQVKKGVADDALETVKKVPGQPPPPIPTINMLGCSPAFAELFTTTPPMHRLHTIQREQYASEFTPRKYTIQKAAVDNRTAKRVESVLQEAKAEATAETSRIDQGRSLAERLETGKESSARLMSKYLRKGMKDLQERRNETLVDAIRQYEALSERWSLVKPYFSLRNEDRQDRPAELADALEIFLNDIHRLLSSSLYSKLNLKQREQLRSMSSQLNRETQQLRREARHRQCRQDNV